MESVACPECGAKIDVPGDVIKGDIITCPDCGLELEVKNVNGDFVEVEELQIEGEDWGE
ncbi:MAG: lysine biosynthesis protein LysW [Candidatus Bathyarchaeia archaeon]